jgi:metallo-beta-lactamase class B
MYLVTGKGVVMFDVPWDTTQYQPLFDSIYSRYHQPVVLCICTRFHDDRTAGLSYLKQRGIPTWSSVLTKELCALHHTNEAVNVFTKDTTFTVGNYSFRTFYPGAGHTKDNIVIPGHLDWTDKQSLLHTAKLLQEYKAVQVPVQ